MLYRTANITSLFGTRKLICRKFQLFYALFFYFNNKFVYLCSRLTYHNEKVIVWIEIIVVLIVATLKVSPALKRIRTPRMIGNQILYWGGNMN